MRRLALDGLSDWFYRENRKPLVLRGARQVGKSTLVRQLAKNLKIKLIEINLEKHSLKSLDSEGIDLQGLIQEIEIISKQRVQPGVLIFFDEIQEKPKLLTALRYFYEDMPWLPVISAGSLLEFALTDEEVSVPVGRIEYFYLGPMTFTEFVMALEEDLLIEHLEKAPNTFLESVHTRLTRLYREYLFIGGMPEAVKVYVKTKSPIEVRRVQRSILQTYQEDFSKYSKSHQIHRVRSVFNYIPAHLGQKLKYSEIDRDERSRDLKVALDLLIQARIVIPVYHSNATGLPLSGLADESVFKTYFLDIGLVNCLQDAGWDDIVISEAQDLITKGAMAEQFVAQHLFYKNDNFESSHLFYWLRDKKAQNAEVDFVISHKGTVLPIEVKAESSGKLKSLFIFMSERKSISRAVKLALGPFTSDLVERRIVGDEEPVVFELLTVPLYLVDRLDHILSRS